MQSKLGEADADGNWQFGSPAPASATDDKTQTVAGYKRRAPTAAAAPFSASNLQAAVHHNAAKEKKHAVESKLVDQGEQPAAVKPNENPATPVPQHVPMASIKSESPPNSNGADKKPIDLTGTVRGTSRNRQIIFSPMTHEHEECLSRVCAWLYSKHRPSRLPRLCLSRLTVTGPWG